MSITKILFQTSITKPEKYLLDKINSFINNDWEYYHFNDNEIIEFFKNNKLDEFPNIIEKFYSMPTGAHKADLFRYYFLYIKGGVFLDFDAMLNCNIEEITNNCSFFTVKSACKGMFQGFIGASPKNLIIYMMK